MKKQRDQRSSHVYVIPNDHIKTGSLVFQWGLLTHRRPPTSIRPFYCRPSLKCASHTPQPSHRIRRRRNLRGSHIRHEAFSYKGPRASTAALVRMEQGRSRRSRKPNILCTDSQYEMTKRQKCRGLATARSILIISHKLSDGRIG